MLTGLTTFHQLLTSAAGQLGHRSAKQHRRVFCPKGSLLGKSHQWCIPAVHAGSNSVQEHAAICSSFCAHMHPMSEGPFQKERTQHTSSVERPSSACAVFLVMCPHRSASRPKDEGELAPAQCTCATEALARGMGSTDRKTSSIGRPSSAWTVLLMTCQGTASVRSRHFSNSRTYSSGKSVGELAMNWPAASTPAIQRELWAHRTHYAKPHYLCEIMSFYTAKEVSANLQ